MELLAFLKEDSEKLAASNLHELMRCWENVHRMWQAEAHVRTVLFREETRWPGYYFRADKPAIDEKNWTVFANCRFDPKTNTWETMARPIKYIFSSQPKEPASSEQIRAAESRGGGTGNLPPLSKAWS